MEFSATSSTGEAVPLTSLPGDIKQLMRDARDRAIKAGAISSKARIPQLDGEGEGGVSTRVWEGIVIVSRD